MAIGPLEKAWSYVKGETKPAPPPAPPAPAAPAQTATPVAGISEQSGAASSPSSSGNVTNAQGDAARTALGGPGRRDEIPKVDVGPKYDSMAITKGSTPLHPETPGSRLTDLMSISQMGDSARTTNDDQRCGATAIVAGAYYAGGTDGVKKLLEDQAAYAKAHNLKTQDPYFGDKELQKRVESGKLTNADIGLIQENLHKTMAERDIPQFGKDPGISAATMREFMNEASHTKKAFDEKGLVIGMIKPYENQKGNHYILSGQLNGSTFVYDPMSMPNSQGQLDRQVTFESGDLRVYRESLIPALGDKYVYSSDNRKFGT